MTFVSFRSFLSCLCVPFYTLYFPFFSLLISTLFYWFLLPAYFSFSPSFVHSHFVDICSLSSLPQHLLFSLFNPHMHPAFSHLFFIASALSLRLYHSPSHILPYLILSYPSPFLSPPHPIPSLPSHSVPPLFTPSLHLSHSVPPGHGIREWLPA